MNHLVARTLTHGERYDGDTETFIADTVRSHPRPGSNSSGNVVAAPLTSGSHPNSNAPGRRKEDDENLVTYGFNHTGGGAKDVALTTDATPPLDSSNAGMGILAASVRRLTPTECERLQGMPDGWTQLGATPDSKRYAALGDAVTANVAFWIGTRLMEAR